MNKDKFILLSIYCLFGEGTQNYTLIKNIDHLICTLYDFSSFKSKCGKIILYNCTFQNLDSFKNYTDSINITIYGSKPTINRSLFSSNIIIGEVK